MYRWIVAIALGLLVACGGTTRVTAQQVVDKLQAAGIELQDVTTPPDNPESPLPRTFTERLSFKDATLDNAGGQVFVCDTKSNCDALMVYFEALKALGGPHFYQSNNGLVVFQLNNGMSQQQVQRYRDVLATLP